MTNPAQDVSDPYSLFIAAFGEIARLGEPQWVIDQLPREFEDGLLNRQSVLRILTRCKEAMQAARELQQSQVVGPDFHLRFQCAANVMCATYRREVGKELLLSVAELLAYDALKAVDALTTPQSSAPVVGDEPDLFWDDNDPEFARESIDEVVHRRWEDGALVTGDTVTVQRAIRLANVTVIATVPDEYPDGDTEITYTVVESALTGRG